MRPTLVCLHGWGGSKESFTELRAALADTDITVLTPDLPGFGDEKEPSKPWTIDDYTDWTERYIKQHKVDRLFLLGHSHGGRIAIQLACRHSIPIEHLFLCAAAGIKHARHVKRAIGLTLAKSGKFFLSVPLLRQLQPVGKKLLYKLVRVHDYEKASPIMRQTLINVTQQDLRPLLSRINLPTDLFWGKQDGMTPFSDALIMKKEIPHATLHAFEGVRHGVHRDKAAAIAASIRSFL
ncbi:MAG: alpha/beta fold hydrolase [Candidatus Peribacteraceae bacterium]|nr:alpha/beta fold hydrolase [Candidatus Peribacteraceae bacterium]